MKTYKIEYSSVMFTDDKKHIYVNSNTNYKKGAYVIIYKKDKGIFIGKIAELDNSNNGLVDKDYSIMSNITKDVEKIRITVENTKRKEQLAKEMEARFAVIDKEKKFEYYATLDDELKSMYTEYKGL